MKRFSLISVASIFLFFMAMLTMPILAWSHPGIEVDPLENKFGEVELGSSSTAIITISNPEFVLYFIDNVRLELESSPDFSITLAPPPGTVLLYGESAEVEVAYTPSALGYASATLIVEWTNADSGTTLVSLEGVGVGAEPPPPVSIADILAFIDDSVADGSLVGTGPGKSAVRRLNALRNQIEAAGDLIEDGLIEEARQQLMDAYRRADGLGPPDSPPDFVAGDAASVLAVMIQKLPELWKILLTRGHVDECGIGYAFYVYLYDGATGNMDIVKENCNDARGLNLNPDKTMIVYTEIIGENEDPSPIYVYDIDSKTKTTICAACANNQGAFFDADGKILFRDYDDGYIKKINTDGTGLTTVATPESPYKFSMFWISPDHEKIVIVEYRREDPNYYKSNYVRLVMMNSDGTDRSVIQDEFLGEWNYLTWKQDSSGFLYYNHVFDWSSGELQRIPKYISFDISDGSVNMTDLSDSDLGIEENILFYTKSGNLVSLGYRELYDGKTGAFIADLSSEIPPLDELMSMMGGGDIYTGEMYIADSDGSNLRRLNIMEL